MDPTHSHLVNTHYVYIIDSRSQNPEDEKIDVTLSIQESMLFAYVEPAISKALNNGREYILINTSSAHQEKFNAFLKEKFDIINGGYYAPLHQLVSSIWIKAKVLLESHLSGKDDGAIRREDNRLARAKAKTENHRAQGKAVSVFTYKQCKVLHKQFKLYLEDEIAKIRLDPTAQKLNLDKKDLINAKNYSFSLREFLFLAFMCDRIKMAVEGKKEYIYLGASSKTLEELQSWLKLKFPNEEDLIKQTKVETVIESIQEKVKALNIADTKAQNFADKETMEYHMKGKYGYVFTRPQFQSLIEALQELKYLIDLFEY